jgi:hypothetical protein
MAYTSYLQLSEASAYGVSDATAGQLNAASRLIDVALGRPEGLLWTPDGNGTPAYMTNKTASRSYQVPAGVAPGASVVITIPNAQFSFQQVGEVVILDAASPSLCEACVITATTASTLTLANVQFTHAANVTADFGLVIAEQAKMRRGAQMVHASRFPIAQILSGFNRYGFGKPPGQISDRIGYADVMLGIAVGIGGPPGWTQLDPTQWDVNEETGEILVLPYFSESGHLELRLRYVAGWSAATLPTQIKQAVANIVRSVIDTPFSANMKLLKAGDSTMERFSPSVIDTDTWALIQPYRVMAIR